MSFHIIVWKFESFVIDNEKILFFLIVFVIIRLHVVRERINDYEKEMPDGYVENLEGMEEIYSLFQSGEIIRSNSSNSNKKEETKDQTLDRMYYRLEKGVIELSNMIEINSNAPAIVPLIPGFR